MDLINRDCISIKPTIQFGHWLKFVDQTATDDTVASALSDKPSTYLIKEFDAGDDQVIRRNLKKYVTQIAHEEFGGWYNDSSVFPKIQSVKDFEKYFSWSYTDMVFDLVDEGIFKDEY